MIRLIGWLFKIIPSILVSVELLVFIYKWFLDIQLAWLRIGLIIGLPLILIVNTFLYFTTYRDLYERQVKKEQNEDEERDYTVDIQTKRMIRKYGLIVLGAIIAVIVYFYYKANLVAMIIRLAIVFVCFLLGEIFRIWDIGIKENRKYKKEKESE